MSSITLEQARALDALDRLGTFQKAAAALHKGHTAVLYAVRGLEEQTGLQLLDRRGYRTKLTAEGTKILAHCRKLLLAERELFDACAEIRTGWEPRLRIVFDGIFPVEPILRVVGSIAREHAPTRIEVTTEFLGRVESSFLENEADLMISVLPPTSLGLRAFRLAPIRAVLVAHRGHPLAKLRGELSAQQAAEHVLLTVRGSDPRLSLSTSGLEQRSTVQLNDFVSKKAAILAGLGFGWMPEHLVVRELRRKEVVRLPWAPGSSHSFEPRLFVREGAKLGRAGQAVVAALRATARVG